MKKIVNVLLMLLVMMACACSAYASDASDAQCMIAVGIADVFETPDDNAERVARASLYQQAVIKDTAGGWTQIELAPGMQTGWVRLSEITAYDENIKWHAEYTVDGGDADLVDVRYMLPNVDVWLDFATPDNFTGKTLYERDICVLRRGTAQKLALAVEKFAQDGYTVRIYDAYRPSSVSGVLYDIVQDSSYIARAGRSVHNRAAAIDMTLLDPSGNELVMPSPIHTMNSQARRDRDDIPDDAMANMKYMEKIMKSCGFKTIKSEWWHFTDEESADYEPLDIGMADIPVITG